MTKKNTEPTIKKIKLKIHYNGKNSKKFYPCGVEFDRDELNEDQIESLRRRGLIDGE